MFSLPPVTQALIIINVLVFLAEGALGGSLGAILALWPPGPRFMPWQMLTYDVGLGGFVVPTLTRDRLEAAHGKRFTAPALLREMAEKGDSFYTRFASSAKAA